LAQFRGDVLKRSAYVPGATSAMAAMHGGNAAVAQTKAAPDKFGAAEETAKERCVSIS
jgi:hypothetical protein